MRKLRMTGLIIAAILWATIITFLFIRYAEVDFPAGPV